DSAGTRPPRHESRYEDAMSTQPNRIAPHDRAHPVPEAPVSQQRAADFLNMHPKTVLRKAREGSLPAHPVGTDRKRWHFYLSELDDWLRSQVITGNHPRRYIPSSAARSIAAAHR